jgi:hypothetical protein
VITFCPSAAPGAALNFVTTSKLPVKIETGFSENASFSICGLGNVTLTASTGPAAHVRRSGMKYSSDGVLLFT